MNIIKNLILFLILLTLSCHPAIAVDLTVNCNADNCLLTPAPAVALFDPSEGYNSDIKPGDNITRTITVNNNRDNNCELILTTKNNLASQPYGLDEVMFTVIKDSLTNYFGSEISGRASSDETLKSLFAQGLINLGIIPANSTRIFNWIVSIDTSVGNNYQRASTRFDFDMNFKCDEPSASPSPTPYPSSTPNPSSSPSSDDGGTGGAEATPIPTPSILGAFASGVTSYLNSFIESTEEIIDMPSIFGIEADGQVKGIEATCCPKICPWWWIIIILQTYFLTRYFLNQLYQGKKPDLIIFSLLIYFVSFFTHFILHRLFINYLGYQESRFCPYFWLISVISIILIDLAYLFIKKQNKHD